MKRNIFFFLGLLLSVLKYALIAAAGLFLLLGILLAGAYKDIYAAYGAAVAGKESLTSAIESLQAKDWDGAALDSQMAQASFNAALSRLSAIREDKVVSRLSPLKGQVRELEYLIKATEIISRSLERAIPLARSLDSIYRGAGTGDFSSLPASDKEALLQAVYEAEPELNGLKANLDLALFNIDKVKRFSILWPIYGRLSEYREQLRTADSLLGELLPMTRLLPALAGYPDGSDFLIIMQNNDELRPTGGFIGVYGLAKTRNGDIVSLDTEDSYHLDMPAVGKWQLVPPLPIKKYLEVENWYLRDANWIPDWPLAAEKIQEIYTGESAAVGLEAPRFDGIIAINPDFVSDLISLVGPITVNGEEYNAANFQELLQYNVEVAYKERDISSWDRKEVVNELLKELEARLFRLPSSSWDDLLAVFRENIASRDLQLYFADPGLEKLAYQLGAAGEMKRVESDFIQVVDANLAAFKSDAVVKKTIAYRVTPGAGAAKAELELGYRHEGDFNWRTTRYRSYTRVYAPFGSRLLSVSGLDESKADFVSLDDPVLNKTIFGFFFTVEPGTEKKIGLEYYLPEKISQDLDGGRYQLYVQKQSGRRTENFRAAVAGKDYSGPLKNDVLISQ
jgi:hypothetical protein